MRTALRFDCVFYYVRDLDRAVDFYTRVLGLPLVSRDAVARFQIDGVLFELVPAKGGLRLDGNGNARLCLTAGDLREAKAELEAAGVAVSGVQEASNGLLATFEDLDGNEIALWQYA
ncbi:MAG TPA: VOC family protein [Thermoanaerobaculia bacterium]